MVKGQSLGLAGLEAGFFILKSLLGIGMPKDAFYLMLMMPTAEDYISITHGLDDLSLEFLHDDIEYIATDDYKGLDEFMYRINYAPLYSEKYEFSEITSYFDNVNILNRVSRTVVLPIYLAWWPMLLRTDTISSFLEC